MKPHLVIFFILFFIMPVLSAQPSMKAIVGGTLIQTDGTDPLEDSVVLIEGNKIIKVGKLKEIPIPQDAQIINAKGKWIIPGLVDAHVHFFQSGGLYTRPDILDLRKYRPYQEELSWIKAHLTDTFARYLRCGVTSVVDVGGPLWNFKVRELAQRTALTPRVAVAGPLISTYQPEELTTEDPPVIKVNSPEEARALVRRQAEWQPDLIKIWFILLPGHKPERYFSLIQTIIEESHHHGIRVVVHATELETARVAVKAGADILAHSVDDEIVDREFIQLLKENHVIYTSTLMVSQRYREVLSQQIRLTTPEREIANPYILSTLFDLGKLPPEDIPPHILSRIRNPKPIFPNPIPLKNLKLLQDAGVTLAVGTDAGNIGTLHGPAIFRELELMAEAGLSNQQILTAATIHGAELMGRSQELGSLEAGKLADMVILHANPLARIQNTRSIDLVIKDGQVYTPDQILK
ncbi:MAG TPA: amidohydrolase family protein [Candidatus Limnocylindrales bacterium]|nr:amidohydrolase family protein [Candidatus Limnocylindrales bacterium]